MTIIDFSKRPVVDFSELCAPVPGMPKQLCLTLPGGMEICTQPGYLHLGLFEYVRLAMGMANSSLAPLGPIFRILDAVAAIQRCLSVIPEILGPPPNPKKLFDALADLAEKMKLVAKLMPMLSVPIMLLQMLDIFIATLEAASHELISIARYLERIQQADLAANQAPGLAEIVKCAKSSAAIQMSNIEYMFASINPTIDMLNMFAGLAQLGDPFPIPHFGGAMPEDPVPAAEALQRVADHLHFIRQSIPI